MLHLQEFKNQAFHMLYLSFYGVEEPSIPQESQRHTGKLQTQHGN